MPTSGAERQRLLKKARKAEGIRARKVWLSDADMDVLKARYPGPRGGIDWTAVICAALNPASAPAADNREIERLCRENRSLERNMAETARRHKELIDNWRRHCDSLDAKLAKAQKELQRLNPTPGR